MDENGWTAEGRAAQQVGKHLLGEATEQAGVGTCGPGEGNEF